MEADANKPLALALLCKAFNVPVLEPTMTISTLPLPPFNTVKKYVQTINGDSTDIDSWIVKLYSPRINKRKQKRQKKAEQKKAQKEA